MKYYGLIARSLIALLFVVAGIQKLIAFGDFRTYLGSIGIPAAMLAAVVVIFIEIVVALLFAFGYKTRHMGYTLMAYTVLVTLVVHRDISNSLNLMMALKNLSIVGGIMLAVCCKDKHHG